MIHGFGKWLAINEVRGLEKFGFPKEFGPKLSQSLIFSGKAELKELGDINDVLAYYKEKKSQLGIKTQEIMCGIVFIYPKSKEYPNAKDNVAKMVALRTIELHSFNTHNRDISGYFVYRNEGFMTESRKFSDAQITDELKKYAKMYYKAYVLTDLSNPAEVKHQRSKNVQVDTVKNKFSGIRTDLATYLIENLPTYRKILEKYKDRVKKQADDVTQDWETDQYWKAIAKNSENSVSRYQTLVSLLNIEKGDPDTEAKAMVETSKLIDDFVLKLIAPSRTVSDVYKTRNTYEICNIFVIWLLTGKVLSDKKSVEQIFNDLGL